MQLDFTKPVYKRNDLVLVGTLNGSSYSFSEESNPQAWAEVQAYLKDHPEALQPEPLPPPPTKEQLEELAESQRQACFAEYDLAVKKHTRWIALGLDADDSMLQKWHEYARKLELVNDTPEWFIDTKWPDKPE